ncbi:hypothetical protein CDG68_15145 [Acinetobacter wuhouensis]|uniref:Uncharacterized protein n=1 Tax=Acinetobacter wuhouensis TaxID=1879050 RepID=A0A3G2T4J4_9GAMM|nr:hypothetical protein CDG68_15145 [Acinetobacter wuhouensis]
MIQLLLLLVFALLCSYLVLVVILKFKIKPFVFLLIGLCLYCLGLIFYIYMGTRVPDGAITVTPEEVANPR